MHRLIFVTCWLLTWHLYFSALHREILCGSVGLQAGKCLTDKKRKIAQLDFSTHIHYLYTTDSLSRRASSWFCVFYSSSVKVLFLTKWLGWELTVEITLAPSSFTLLFAAPLSEPVFLSRRTPAVSGWSQTRCDRPNVILMYQQSLALSVSNLDSHFILLKQHWASFFLLLGHVVMKRECFGMSPLYPWRKSNSED